MVKDPSLREIASLFKRPAVNFVNGLSRTDNDAAYGYASDIKNFDIINGVAIRRRGSRCLSNPSTAKRWRAFHEVSISGVDVLLGITMDRRLKAFLSQWTEVEFSVYRHGIQPMVYPESGEETFEVKFTRGDKFWLNNEDGQYLRIVNDYGDALRIDKRGYFQIMPKMTYGTDYYKPEHMIDSARTTTDDLAIYIDVLDATNRNIYDFNVVDRQGGSSAKLRGAVKLASVNECGVVGKMCEGVVFPEPKEPLFSMVPITAVRDNKIDLKYQGTVYTGAAEEGVSYATRNSDNEVTFTNAVESPAVDAEFFLYIRQLSSLDSLQVLLVPTDDTYTLDTSVFYQLPSRFNITEYWDGNTFDYGAGTPVPMGMELLNMTVEAELLDVSALLPFTDPQSFDATLPLTIDCNDVAAGAYQMNLVGMTEEELLGKINTRRRVVSVDGTALGNAVNIVAIAKCTTKVTALSTPYVLSNPAYKFDTDIIESSSLIGLVDRGLDVWQTAGAVSLSTPALDPLSKKASITASTNIDAVADAAALEEYVGASSNVGYGKTGRFAVWNNGYIVGKSSVGWQQKSDSFNFLYSLEDSLYSKSVDDTAATGRVINQLPTGYADVRLESFPVMGLRGIEFRKYAYEEPVIYEPIQDPSHLVSNSGRVFVVQGARIWVGNLSTLMLDTPIDVDFTVHRLEPFFDGALAFTDKGMKKVDPDGKIRNVNTDQLKSEDVKSTTHGGNMVYGVSELDEVFQVTMIFEGTTVPYPKAILVSAPIHRMEWGANPKMAYVDGTLWIAREGDVWGYYNKSWSKQKDFTGKTIDHIFGFQNELCIAFYDHRDVLAEDYYEDSLYE